MRRFMLLAVSVLMLVTMAVSPAFAHDWDGDGFDEENGFWILVPVFVEFDVDFEDIDCDWDDCDWDDCDWDDCDWDDDDWHDEDWDDCEGPVCLID